MSNTPEPKNHYLRQILIIVLAVVVIVLAVCLFTALGSGAT